MRSAALAALLAAPWAPAGTGTDTAAAVSTRVPTRDQGGAGPRVGHALVGSKSHLRLPTGRGLGVEQLAGVQVLHLNVRHGAARIELVLFLGGTLET